MLARSNTSLDGGVGLGTSLYATSKLDLLTSLEKMAEKLAYLVAMVTKIQLCDHITMIDLLSKKWI